MTLTDEQVHFYHDRGYLRIPRVYGAEELAALRDDLDWMIETWANRTPGWSGPWRQAYMDERTERKSQLIAMHDLHFYAESWMRAATKAAVAEVMSRLLDAGPVELHHLTMHVKPPETGHPFPMHQDRAFYKHADDRYVDALLHLDDTSPENGEIRFLAGSHKGGPLTHVTEFAGEPCTPHLPTDAYRLEDTVAVPAEAGDLVVFNIHTIHGSHINQTDRARRMVRMGYRRPENAQAAGQSVGRPGLMLRGRRPRAEGQELFPTSGPSGVKPPGIDE